MNKTILVIAAHPDDELLGCGGTIIKHIKNGDTASTLILGEGMTSRNKEEQESLEKLHKDAKVAADIIGFENIFFADLPDNKFDSVALLDIVKIVEKYISEIKPDIVYTHHGYDINIDHQKTFHAVITACRPCNQYCPEKIYTFETLSSTEWQHKDHKQFAPNTYINIEKELDQKIEAMEAYTSEIRNFPHSRSSQGIRTLATYRGIESGQSAAEAFHLVRSIQN